MFLLKKMHDRCGWFDTECNPGSDISRELMVTLGTVTTSLNNLERKSGYIEGRRSVLIAGCTLLSLI